jgi:hypothetical protein
MLGVNSSRQLGLVSRGRAAAAVLVTVLALSAACSGTSSEEGGASCSQGSEGCGCFSDYTCATGATALVCAGTTCVRATCPPGTGGCPCAAGALCDDGACEDGLCVPSDRAAPPESPVCYTPCQSGIVRADGTWVPCSVEGLMEGCLDGKACVGGSCVASGASPPACTGDVDCAEFQVCIQGGCYSNCRYDTDCTGGRQCYKQACRTPCSTDADTCPTGTACVSTDGTAGYCMPTRAPDGVAQTEVVGTFSLSADHVAFSSSHLSGSVVITNDAPMGIEFKVRKLEHTEFGATGPVVVTTAPLNWVTLASGASAPAAVQELTVFVDGNGGTGEIRLANAANASLSRWEGRIEISNATLGRQVVTLGYVSRPEGHWSGKMHYFGAFGDQNLDAWMVDRTSNTKLGVVGNAFVQRWGAFKNGAISWNEFQAVMTATVTGSWRWKSVSDVCTTAACYLYDSPSGFGPYTDSFEQYPIPTAVSELPVGVNLKVDPADGLQLVGKIVSASSLHYAGDPALTVRFTADPTTCKAGVVGACLAPLQSIDARIRIGGRYATTSGDGACGAASAGSFALAAVPWLVPGFTEGTELDPASGIRRRYECEDELLPFGAGASEPYNQSLARSNPIPDGRPRVRRIELVDGALVDQETLFIIFRERFEESFLGAGDTEGFSAYGVLTLKRSPAELDDGAYAGSSVADTRTPPSGLLGASCSPEIVERILGPGGVVDGTTATTLAHGVIEGIRAGAAATPIDPLNPAHPSVHYLCHDLGIFDGGAFDDGSATGVKRACPAGSGVTFFLSTLGQAEIAAQNCQLTGVCAETLAAWRLNGTYAVEADPLWRCTDPAAVFCDADRLDLRANKTFFLRNAQEPAFLPIATAIDQAFRYKTQFQNRQGTSVGFTPEICVRDGDVVTNAIPYCYDPPGIDEARKRVDCAVSLFKDHYASLDSGAVGSLKSFLEDDFSYSQDYSSFPVQTRDGFERLNAELLIMLGDEAYTRAFASRFDLAGSRELSFPGALFEPGGINLAGAAGNEMYNLYQATQYYQSALDRFYALSPAIWGSVSSPDAARNFITMETVVTWFDRLARASTQKARAWSEVAKRYQGFNRPDLARLVAERAYTSAYVESIVLSRMMLQVVNVVDPADRAQIHQRVDLASLSWRATLLDMRDAYAAITDDVTVLGFAPDYIPFPALDPGDVNAFTKMLAAAKSSAAAAATKEEVALSSTRAFDTDAAQFEAELVRLRTSYEGQLSNLCGTFVGGDDLVHPATSTYAYLHPVAQYLGDPCGFVGNGQIHDAMAGVELARLEVVGVQRRFDDLVEQQQIETDRVNAQCGLALTAADYKWTVAGQVNDLQGQIRASRLILSGLTRAYDTAKTINTLMKCSTGTSTDCPAGAVATAKMAVESLAFGVATTAQEAFIASRESRIAEIERTATLWDGQHQCEVLQADSNATMRKLVLEFAHVELEALKVEYRLRLALSDLQKLRNEATRLHSEQQELEQQTINVAAARNDPNVRIYKNDAVILADETFQQALRDAYKATKVFEYFTSQSYARLDQLFLIRMVSHGDYNLESYLMELENAYRDFQQLYGNPDTRVEVISLRDDVLAVPRTASDGRALTQAERIAELRRRLSDTALLDERGYLTLPFSTSLGRLSPLTRNHKVLAVEAEVVGSDVGDTVGRVYLRQRGTGLVLSVDGDRSYYRLPDRTAVLNPFFNGVRTFGPEVYRSDRMRNRPLVNTHWELVINQRDELANQDINLGSLTDVRLYVYYTDFTQL